MELPLPPTPPPPQGADLLAHPPVSVFALSPVPKASGRLVPSVARASGHVTVPGQAPDP